MNFHKRLKIYLTNQQYKIFILLGQGYTYQEIQLELFISYSTVKVHVNELMQKLLVNTREEIIILAIKSGCVGVKQLKDCGYIPTLDELKHEKHYMRRRKMYERLQQLKEDEYNGTNSNTKQH